MAFDKWQFSRLLCPAAALGLLMHGALGGMAAPTGLWRYDGATFSWSVVLCRGCASGRQICRVRPGLALLQLLEAWSGLALSAPSSSVDGEDGCSCIVLVHESRPPPEPTLREVATADMGILPQVGLP